MSWQGGNGSIAADAFKTPHIPDLGTVAITDKRLELDASASTKEEAFVLAFAQWADKLYQHYTEKLDPARRALALQLFSTWGRRDVENTLDDYADMNAVSRAMKNLYTRVVNAVDIYDFAEKGQNKREWKQNKQKQLQEAMDQQHQDLAQSLFSDPDSFIVPAPNGMDLEARVRRRFGSRGGAGYSGGALQLGAQRKIYTGPKGGQYYLDRKQRRVYVRRLTPLHMSFVGDSRRAQMARRFAEYLQQRAAKRRARALKTRKTRK